MRGRINLPRVALVRARVADEHVVGIVRHVGPVPTNPVVAAYSPKSMLASREVAGIRRLRTYSELKKTGLGRAYTGALTKLGPVAWHPPPRRPSLMA